MTKQRSAASAVTAREREVLSLIEAHLTNSQIADALYLSVRTVESHVSSLMRKLQVTDRRSLARQAGRTGHNAARDRARWPAPVSSYVGRSLEESALSAAITEHRMVTVAGPGGVGKTRLTVQVARDLAAARRDGGWFVDLIRVTDPAMVIPAVATVIGVAEPPGGSVADAVVAALHDSDAVLVLDNCEHLVDAARSCVARLLSGCPSLHLVATSRVRLAAPFEWVYEVPGLSVVDGGGDGVRLFVERAVAAGGVHALDHHQVSVLCRSLDGMALAIELAAGRYPSLGLDGLITGLDQQLRYLTTRSQGEDRHRSLRDAIGWSYHLLDPADQILLGEVSVFATWFDVSAATAVCGTAVSATAGTRADVADTLARLADHHLIVAAPGQPTRYRALEAIRQYAAEQVDLQGRAAVVHDRHRRWCSAELTDLSGQVPDDAWCVRFDRVADDARAALGWAAEHGLEGPTGALSEQLAEQLLLRGQPAESQRRYEEAARLTISGHDRIRLLRLAAGVAAARVAGNDTVRLLDVATTGALDLGDRPTAADCRAWMVIYLNMMPGIIAVLPTADEGDRWLEEARAYSDGSAAVEGAVAIATASGLPDPDPAGYALALHAVQLAQEAAAPLVHSVALDQLCTVSLARRDLTAASGWVRQRGEVLDVLPLDAATAYQLNDYLLMASEIHLGVGDLPLAASYADRLAALPTYREQDHLATSRRIKVDALAGHLHRAAAQGERFLAAWNRSGRPIARTLNVSTYALAMVHALLGDDGARQDWTDLTLELTGDRATLDDCRTGWAPTFDALVALDRGNARVALNRLSADIDDHDVWDSWLPALWRPWYAALWVEAAVLTGHPDTSDRLRRGAVAARENPIASAIVQRAGDLALHDHRALARYPAAFAGLGCPYQKRRSTQLHRT